MTTHNSPEPVEPKRPAERLMRRAVLAAGLLVMVAALAHSTHADAGKDQTKFKRFWRPMYIAALGDARANSGTSAQSWGLWRLDPGPRGVRLDRYERLNSARGIAPAQWKFDSTDWWLEE